MAVSPLFSFPALQKKKMKKTFSKAYKNVFLPGHVSPLCCSIGPPPPPEVWDDSAKK